MNPLALLHEALRRDPGDDAAWLALADLLEEEGNPSGEAVRLSVYLRRRLDDPDWPTWERRQRELAGQGVRVPLPTLRVPLIRKLALEMVLVPPGSFRMGSRGEGLLADDADDDELPCHVVELTRGFYLGIHPVTQAQWQEVLGESPSHFRGARRPVDSVSWESASRFCATLSERTGRRFRLPSEAEWEYACAAGSATLFAFGDTITTDQANYDGTFTYGDSPRGIYRHQTTSVGSFPPNAWGLCDLHGNVWEWCQDWFGAGYYRSSPRADPPGPSSGEVRVLRGGSWFFSPRPCRTTYRFYDGPQAADDDYGCRVAMDLGPPG